MGHRSMGISAVHIWIASRFLLDIRAFAMYSRRYSLASKALIHLRSRASPLWPICPMPRTVRYSSLSPTQNLWLQATNLAPQLQGNSDSRRLVEAVHIINIRLVLWFLLDPFHPPGVHRFPLGIRAWPFSKIVSMLCLLVGTRKPKSQRFPLFNFCQPPGFDAKDVRSVGRICTSEIAPFSCKYLDTLPKTGGVFRRLQALADLGYEETLVDENFHPKVLVPGTVD